MKPPAFNYVRASSVEEAVSNLAHTGGDAKILAGGQSLVPALNFRLLRPSMLVDINQIASLKFITAQETELGIGALTRHYALETSPIVRQHFPILSEAMTHVAHLAIRNRGTIGGSLSHADPAAELPMLAILLDARIWTFGSSQGKRCHAAGAFFRGALTTVLEETEIVTHVALPLLSERTGWGFAEVARRRGDFAIVAAGALLTVRDDRVDNARLVLTGISDTPIRLPAVEDLLRSCVIDAGSVAQAAQVARDAVAPNADLHASADYRRHLVGVLTRRVLIAAWHRALGEIE